MYLSPLIIFFTLDETCPGADQMQVANQKLVQVWAGQDELKRAYLQIPVLLYTMEQVFLAQGLVYVFKWYLKRNVHSELDVESNRDGVRDLDGAEEETPPESGKEDKRTRHRTEERVHSGSSEDEEDG